LRSKELKVTGQKSVSVDKLNKNGYLEKSKRLFPVLGRFV
jgi:hypothetical protein